MKAKEGLPPREGGRNQISEEVLTNERAFEGQDRAQMHCKEREQCAKA